MIRDLQDLFNLFLYGTAECAHDLKAGVQFLGHEPHVFHDAAKAQDPKDVSLRGRGPFPGIIHHDKDCRPG